jgi:hypothetical protein
MLLGHPYRNLRLPAALFWGSKGSDFNKTKRWKISVMPLICRAATSHSEVSLFKEETMERWRRNLNKFCVQRL